MSHVYASYQDPSTQRLTLEETRELIERLERRRVPDNSVSVQEVADALGVPSSEVLEMVWQLRTKRPVSSGVWLRRNLWIWVLTALAAIFIAGQGYVVWMNRNITQSNLRFAEIQFPYRPESRALGEALDFEAPGGFSFYVSDASRGAAVLGEQDDFPHVARLSKAGVAQVQGKLADDIVRAFDKMARQDPYGRLAGDQLGRMELNYYPGGTPVILDVMLRQSAFPYSVDNAESRDLRSTIVSKIQDHWEEFTAETGRTEEG